MLMLWQRLRKKWSVKMDKNLYMEIKDNNGNFKGWADKRYLKKSKKKIVSTIGLQKNSKKTKENP